MKLSFPILLALALLLATVSFVRAEAASGVDIAPLSSGARLLQAVPVKLTSTITTTSIVSSEVITGVVINGSGTSLPEGLPVTLYTYQPGQETMELVLTTTTTADPVGVFTFENIPKQDDSVFMTSVLYAGVPYHSFPSVSEPMTVTVFDVTTDTNDLIANQLHMIFDISETGELQVVEVYILTNIGIQTILIGEVERFVEDFPLPEGALSPSFRSGVVDELGLETHDGFLEFPAVRPGDLYGISYIFSMYYPGKATLNQPIEIPVSSVGVLLPAGGTLTIESAQLVDGGFSDFGGATYQVYTAENISPGEQLAVKISGDLNASASGAAVNSSGSQLGLIIGLGAFGLVLILAGVWFGRRTRKAFMEADLEMVEGEEPVSDSDERTIPADADALMDDIIALDDLYQAGELAEAAYHERRAELKEKLRIMTGDNE